MKCGVNRRLFSALLLAAALWPGSARAQVTPIKTVSVTVTLDPTKTGSAIPEGFLGLSFEMEKALPDANGDYFFRSDNTPLVNLFKTLGIKSLRLGGNTADRPTLKTPSPKDVDSLFGFAKRAGVKVLYTLRLRQGDPGASAAIAKYIWDNDRSSLDCFALGNEPSGYTKGYPAYHDAFQTYMTALTAPNIAPDAQMSGPGATGGTASWTRSLAADFGKSGHLAFVTQHYYPFGPGTKVTDPAAGRDLMLSADDPAQYEKFYAGFGPAAAAVGVSYRLEETNNFYFGGAENVSDTLAAALWGLDSLYWWASHGAIGVNFHAGDHVARGDTNVPCWYSPFWTSTGGYAAHPLAYGMKAFDIGSHGRLIPAVVSTSGINLTAYAVLTADGSVRVTLINKSHGADAVGASVSLVPADARRGRVMFLTAPQGDMSAKTGVTLGGAAITDDGSWAGTWLPLPPASNGGALTVTVPAASAAVVDLSPALL
jgi:hypothetical protein